MAKRRKRRTSWLRWHWKKLLIGYAILLVASHLVLVFRPDTPRTLADNQAHVMVDGKRLSYRSWGGASEGQDPLILLHGSPSRGSAEFEALGTYLATEGRQLIAIDRWGYGDSERWVDDYSFDADARAVLGLMDALNIGTAHLGGWSYGGAPAVQLANAQPGRIRSVSLIASIGDQKGEGSGSYLIEHTKYAGLMVLVMGLPELVPHFGLLGPRHVRYAFARDFWDADQRPLEGELRKLAAPLLLVHGKSDPLIPAWLAQYHHQLQPDSRLVMLDASHFFPMRGDSEDFRIFGGELKQFLIAAEEGQTGELGRLRNETRRTDFRTLWEGGPALRGPKNWWLLLVPGALLGFFAPRTGAVLAGLAGGLLIADLVTALGTLLMGVVVRRGDNKRLRKTGLVLLWGVGASIPASLLFALL